ncbi:MAG: nitrogen regulation protein NR(II) [Acidobacteriota bacterium]
MRELLTVPRRDLTLQVVLVLFLAVLLLSLLLTALFPSSEGPLLDLTTLGSILVLVTLLQQQSRDIRHREERRFWYNLQVALLSWGLATGLPLAWSAVGTSGWGRLTLDVLYLTFYLMIVLGIESRPDLGSGWTDSSLTHRFSVYSSIVFVFGLLVYFVLIPSNFWGQDPPSWLSSVYLYLVLDLYLLIQFLELLWTTKTDSWKNCYTLMALTAGLWSFTDFRSCLRYAGLIPTNYTFVDLLSWYLPFVTIAWAVRLRRGDSRTEQRVQKTAWRPQSLNDWKTVSPTICAFLFPLIHFSAVAFGLFDVASLPHREVAVLVFVGILAALAYTHQLMLQRKNDDLETEREEARRERERMHARMMEAQKLESLGALAGGIAHDFNNLLTCILSYSSLALLETQGDSRLRDHIEKIGTAGRRASDLTNQMLTFAGKSVFVLSPVKLNRAVREIAQLLQTTISKKVDLRYEFAPSLPAIEAERSQLGQVVMNLIINASEAIGDGKGLITIQTGLVAGRNITGRDTVLYRETASETDWVFLEVSDTGCGMASETVSRIFDPFFTTKFTGRGLGLATVLGIVRGHGGMIQIDSQPRRGTQFRVLFSSAGQPHP